MPRGQPDFGMYRAKETGATLSDMADLAVRLGSIVEFDRRGDIVFIDNFESPLLRWETSITGAGEVYFDDTSVKSGSQALKLLTDIGVDQYANMGKYLYTLGSRRLGAECHFSNPSDDSKITLYIYSWNGIITYQGWVIVDIQTGIVSIRCPADENTVIATGFSFPQENFAFIPLKLVGDFENGEYVRLMLGNVEYDISSYEIWSVASAVSPRDYQSVQITNKSDTELANCWIDNYIWTQNEP